MTCRPPRNRPNPRLITLPDPAESPPPAVPDVAPPAEHPLVETYRARLEKAKRLDTPEGEHVLMLARMFAGGTHTAAGASSLSRELRAAMAEAMQGAPGEADLVDELRERRRQREASA